MTSSIQKIDPAELLDLGDYERARQEIRERAMAARSLRRVLLGEHAALSFESRETVLYQIQEMLRAERIAKPDAVAEEAAAYEDLLPGRDSLGATLMFEFPEAAQRDRRLAELVGIERHLSLEAGPAGRSVANFDAKQLDPARVSAVQFVRFPVSAPLRAALVEGVAVRVVITHPSYACSAPIPSTLAKALAADLERAA